MQYYNQPPGGLPYPNQAQGSTQGIGEVLPHYDAANAPIAAAPPMPIKDMDRIDGYQNMMHSDSFIPPPPTYEEALKQPDRGAASEQQFKQRPQLTQEEARSCLYSFVKSQRFWGTGPVETMVFQKIEATTAVHYLLSTYLETRSSDWAYEPYNGQHVDGPQFGYAPRPWEIVVQTPPWFEDQTIDVEVPHTASVKMCHGCKGQANILCRSCNGWGYNRCFSCSGGGHSYEANQHRNRCYSCGGSGRIRCYKCEGAGRVPCDVCEACGRLKFYIRLTCIFKTHAGDFIIERTPLPDELIRNVEGTITFEDTQAAVHPLRSHPEREINQSSQMIVNQHRQLARNGRIWMQSHIVREVPVFQCDCTYQGKPLQFYVYGHNRHVFLYDYPQKCCCCKGCEIL